jgi:hypothetical protein
MVLHRSALSGRARGCRYLLELHHGSRSTEYQSPQYKGCFEVVVTVIYRYDTLVPFLGSAAPNFLRIASSTTMLAEY